ncbi:(2Fe-2S)-binding protein [Mobilicoccus massiliensis]|uniref:(2Fe-2S)-binding protein n=1 Tax=Mobilicoccus massiliensis TaxID=1522310 RepID=UPI0009E3C61F|nr:(2Fe-2S)-binding protein [Mobilicoccus massiliensis]
MIVCHCEVVSDRDIRKAVDDGACTLAQTCRATRAGTGCGACVFGVRAVLETYTRQDHITLHEPFEETDAATQPPRRRVA